MNVALLTGRLAQDPTIRYTQGGLCWASFSVAVENPGKDKGASYPSCKAFGETAQIIEKKGHKGGQVAITGHIQTGSYTNKKGDKVYTTDIITDRIEFFDKAEKVVPDQEDRASAQPNPIEGFSQLAMDEDIPF